MTTILATISQAVADHDSPPSFQGGASLGAAADTFFAADYQFAQDHSDGGAFVRNGDQMAITYDDDGSTAVLSGFPASATGSDGTVQLYHMQQTTPDTQRADFQGTLNYHYHVTDGAMAFDSLSGTLTHASIATQVPFTSSYYDHIFGNSTVTMDGNVAIAANGDFSGTVNSLQGHSDAMVASSTINGAFTVHGNTQSIGAGTTGTSVGGVMNSFDEYYTDGSYFRMENGSLAVDGNTQLDETLLANPANFTGDDVINISLPAVIHSDWTVAAGDGNDNVTIKGGGESLSVDAGNGNDVITLGDDGHDIDGGAGFDKVILKGPHTAYTVASNSNGGFDVQTSDNVFDVLSNVERLQFSDATMALDISGTGGQAYRIYQAAFNRTPDSTGLGFWINAMDHGASLKAVADGFVHSDEFSSIYGAAPSNTDIVNRFYQNVLHRAGDAGGIAFWVGKLDSHEASVAEVLTGFSESTENQTALASVIGNGFFYTPYSG